MKVLSTSKTSYFYWLLPPLLWLGYVLFTFNSLNQIGYEDLAESVRNVFWLQHRMIYDGASSNVAWNGILLLIYNIFGFSLFTAKFFRLFLQLISLFALAKLIKMYVVKYSWVVFTTLALSPTLMYLTTSQTPVGIDLQMLPICLVGIQTLTGENRIRQYIQSILVWILIMLTALSYAAFIFYIPPLIYLYIRRFFTGVSKKPREISLNLFVAITSFFFPLLVSLIYVKNREKLIYDPITHSGIFRGSGHISFPHTYFLENFFGIFQDLFIVGNSYVFQLTKVDFSDGYAFIVVLLIIGISMYLFYKKRGRELLFMVWLVMLSTYLIGSITIDASNWYGIRRSTPILAGCYALFIFAWNFLFSLQGKVKKILIAFLLLLFVHHLFVLPINIMHQSDLTKFASKAWLLPNKTPSESLELLVDAIQKKDIELKCEVEGCRYQEIFAEIEGACTWNKLSCHNIYGYNPYTRSYKKLEISVWDTYYFPH